MFNENEYERAKEVLKHEPIRLINGMYSGGNVYVPALIQLIHDGLAVEYVEDGHTFVKAKEWTITSS